MSRAFDVIVAGLGGMGSAILAECARREIEVIGIDRYPKGHAQGSSSGRSRLFRKAYFEDERYIPLLQRAEVLWRRLEKESGTELLRTTGLLLAGAETSTVLQRAAGGAARHGIRLDGMNAGEVRARFPGVRIMDDESAMFEPGAGVLDPEAAIAANLRLAREIGAEQRHDTALSRWIARNGEIEVTLADGSQLRAAKLVLALGPWFGKEMKELAVPLRIERNVQVWFSPATTRYDATNFPAFLIDRPGLPGALYGFPNSGEGIKAAFHGSGVQVEPDSMSRSIDQGEDVLPLQAALNNWMPGAADRYLSGKACMYSLTPDQNFVLGRHPHYHNVIFCGGFSGHGFKFAPVVGEIAVDLALEQETNFEIDFLSPKRFLQC